MKDERYYCPCGQRCSEPENASHVVAGIPHCSESCAKHSRDFEAYVILIRRQEAARMVA